MKKFKILIPVYNDWESLVKLLEEINKIIEDIKNVEFDCIVINDASNIKPPKLKSPQNIKYLTYHLNNFHASTNNFRCLIK